MPHYVIQTVSGVVVGQNGQTIPLSVLDSSGDAADLSAYTAVVLRAISPDAQTTRQITGSFVLSSGGTLTVTPSTSNSFDVDGDWESQIQLSDTGILALTIPFIIQVSKQI